MMRGLVVAMLVLAGLAASTALGQCGCGVPAVVGYAPAVSYYAPSVSYYAPTTAYYAPVPYTAYYAPPAPYVSYYAAPVARPYAAYYGYGVPGWSAWGTPRYYVPGEPVRNVFRAVTP